MPTGPDLPSAAMLMRIAADHGLDLTTADADSYRALMAGAIESYRKLEESSAPEPRVKYPRDGGWRPKPEDNPCNGWYWRCNIAGAASGVHRQQIRLEAHPPTSSRGHKRAVRRTNSGGAIPQSIVEMVWLFLY